MKEREGIRAKAAKLRPPKRAAPKRRTGQKVRRDDAVGMQGRLDITAYGDADTKRKALENGAEALFTKPVDFLVLRNEIEMRVERAA